MEVIRQVALEALIPLAEKLRAAKERKKELEDETKQLNADIKDMQTQLGELMVTADVPNFGHDGKTFYLKAVLHASPKAGQKEAFFKALRSHDFGDLIVEQVNARTLESFVKEQKRQNVQPNGEEVVPDWLLEVLNVYEGTEADFRKA